MVVDLTSWGHLVDLTLWLGYLGGWNLDYPYNPVAMWWMEPRSCHFGGFNQVTRCLGGCNHVPTFREMISQRNLKRF